jgi:hypothetical protein
MAIGRYSLIKDRLSYIFERDIDSFIEPPRIGL